MSFAVHVTFALQHRGSQRYSDRTPKRHRERNTRAARLLGYVDTQLAALEAQREYTEQQEYDKMLPALHAALGADECTRLMAEGSTSSEDHAVAEAMLI
jgi:hypothetical protein